MGFLVWQTDPKTMGGLMLTRMNERRIVRWYVPVFSAALAKDREEVVKIERRSTDHAVMEWTLPMILASFESPSLRLSVYSAVLTTIVMKPTVAITWSVRGCGGWIRVGCV